MTERIGGDVRRDPARDGVSDHERR
jgi:hypothetical protein